MYKKYEFLLIHFFGYELYDLTVLSILLLMIYRKDWILREKENLVYLTT